MVVFYKTSGKIIFSTSNEQGKRPFRLFWYPEFRIFPGNTLQYADPKMAGMKKNRGVHATVRGETGPLRKWGKFRHFADFLPRVGTFEEFGHANGFS